MANDNIVKTVVTITVLHRADNELGPAIQDVIYEYTEGDAVGWETSRETTPVPPEKVVDELVALGNDGEFFEPIDDDEDEEDEQ